MKLKLLISCLLIASVGFAKTDKDYNKQLTSWSTKPEKWLKDGHWVDSSFLDKGKSEKKVTRSSASNSDPKESSWYESKMSDAMKQVRKEFLALDSTNKLDAMLTKLDKDYDTYPTDLKFFAAQAIPLQAMRGVIWKMVPALENTKILHSLLVTQVKAWAVNQRIFFPAQQWTVGFDYVTQPYMEDEILPKRFKNEADIQGFMASAVYPELSKAAARISALDMSSDEIVWDNQLIYGASKSPEALDQYRLFGTVEQFATMSSIEAAMAQITFNRAYSMQDGFKLSSAIGKEYGLDSFLNQVDGVPSAKVVSIIRSTDYPFWGKLFTDGVSHLALARAHSKNSIIYAQKVIQEMEKRHPNEEFFTDTSVVGTAVTTANPLGVQAGTVVYDRAMQYRFKKMIDMLDGQTELRSAATGETTTVNLPEFFAHPPASLKLLYGKQFNEESEMLPFKVDGAKVAEYRNYQHGRPTSWDITLYKKYFPKATSDAELLKAARIFSQSWGGVAISVPLSTYIE